jgi:hypothetical protein
MPRGKFNLASAKVTRKNVKHREKQTRKQARFLDEKDRRERIMQGAIAGAVVEEEIENLQAAGVIPLGEELELDDAEIVLLNAAAHAAEPVPLMTQIRRQAALARAQIQRPIDAVRGELRAAGQVVRRYTPRELVGVFISLAMMYWATFPAHAAPGKTSLFDAAAGHLSGVGTAMSLLSLPHAGTIGALAVGAKLGGHAMRVTNAFTGMHPMTNSERRRAKLNVMEFAPYPAGTVMTVGRLGGIAAGAEMNRRAGASNYLGAAKNLFMAGAANVGVKMGKRYGHNEAAALEAMMPSAY